MPAVGTSFGVWCGTAVDRHHGIGAWPTPTGFTTSRHVLLAPSLYDWPPAYMGMLGLIIYAL